MKNLRILYIEDDPLDSLAVKRVIRKENLDFDLTITETITASKKLLQTQNFDLIIADYLLKDGNAFEVFDMDIDAPIVFITGAGDEEIAVKAMKKGAYDYLIKDKERNYLKILPITIFNAIKNHESKERIRLLESSVLNTNDAILITKANRKSPLQSTVVFQNEAFTKLSGYLPNELADQHIGRLFGKSTDPQTIVTINQNLQGCEAVRTELVFYNKKEEPFWADMTIVPIFGKSQQCTHYVFVARDVSARKKNVAELIKAKQAAEDARKAETHFLAVMSHEIRTPMNAIVGLSNLMLDTNPNVEQLEYAKSIKTTADNLLALINDILDLPKIEQQKIEFSNIDFNISELIKNTVQALKFAAEDKGLSVLITNDIDLPSFVKGDPVRLNQIVTNLLGNAIKFTQNGEISVTTKVLNKTGEKISIQLQVSDTGIGIDPSKLDTIFEKYQQADNEIMVKYGGSGLGLYIVKQLVTLQNGTIDVHTEQGKGATFSIKLDFAISDKCEATESPFDRAQDLKNIKVLVGEDNLMNKRIIKKMLEKWNAKAVVMENGKLVINELQKNDYHVILMDIQMPEMDGIQTINHIRNKMEQDIPIIVMTASALTNKHDIIKEDINGFIQKPFDPTNLLNMILKCTAQDTPLPDQATKTKSIQNKSYDLSYLANISRNNRSFITEMVEIFIKQANEAQTAVPTYVQHNKLKEIAQCVHKIKSSARNIGNRKMAENCQQIEESIIHNAEPAIINPLIEQFLRDCSLTKEQLAVELQRG